MIITFERAYHGGADPTFMLPRLFRVRGNSVIFVRDATPEELAAYDEARDLLLDFGRGDQLLIASEMNFDELVEAIVNVHHPEGESPDHFANALEMNRRLVNYLSARRLYLDFSQTRMTRWHGEASQERAAFDTARTTAYDGDFNYRFAEKLRNYSQHFGFPIGHVAGTSRLDVQTNEKTRTVEVCFDVRELVRVSKDIWGRLRAELDALPSLLPVVPVIAALPAHLRTIRDAMRDAEMTAFVNATDTLLELLRDADQPGSRLSVGHWLDNAGRLAFEYDEFPAWALRQVSLRASDAVA